MQSVARPQAHRGWKDPLALFTTRGSAKACRYHKWTFVHPPSHRFFGPWPQIWRVMINMEDCQMSKLLHRFVCVSSILRSIAIDVTLLICASNRISFSTWQDKQNTTCNATWLFCFVSFLICASNQMAWKLWFKQFLKKVQEQKVASLFWSALIFFFETLAQKVARIQTGLNT